MINILPSQRTWLPMATFLLIASLGVGCSGCSGGATEDAAASAAGAQVGADAAGADGANADAANAGVAAGHEGHGHSAGGDHSAGAAASDPWKRTYDSPAAERAGTVENLNGLRATLVTELESVRGRLKDGTRSAEDRKADTQRAAELAQGLERLDRTIKQISEANDVTWTQVRDSELKAAGEFREWMAKYGMAS